MAKSTKDKIKEFEKFNTLLAENLVDAIWIIDARTLTCEYITPSIYKISGYTPDELINTKITDRLSPESKKISGELLIQALKELEHGKSSPRSLELELMHKSGDTYWVEIRAKLVVEPGDSPKLVGITKEITSKKKAEHQQEQLTSKLITALAEKEKLLREIKVLEKLLPICSGCKRIRGADGRWWPLELYVSEHTNSDFTHTICTDCQDLYYPTDK